MLAQEISYVRDLVAARREGFSLPGGLYRDSLVYQAELEAIWKKQWLFAGHTCQIPKPGDYLTFQVGDDSILITRQDDGGIAAMHNVCRHRGTLLCEQDAGHVGRIVCPYHQWVYGRGGELVSCRGMNDEIDKGDYSLVPVKLEELAGMIFISLAENPPAFERARELMEPMALPQGLREAKVAKIVDYEIAANWKLVWENNRECYHCNVNHPQYIKANWDHYNSDDTSEKIKGEIQTAVTRSEAKWAEAGLAVTHRVSGMFCFPDPEHDIWYSANRTPLVEGYLSESMDGRMVAPLMGSYADADVGTLRMRTVPNFWNHSSCDHAVSTRLAPNGPQGTLARVMWLVHPEAEEGRDYKLEELMPFWQLTSEQDWELCDRAQRGVNSSGYVPGPYSSVKEYNVDAFARWYVKEMREGLG